MDDFNKFVSDLTETIFNVAILMALIFGIVAMVVIATWLGYVCLVRFGEFLAL